MLAPGTVLDLGDHTVQVLSTPEQTTDRYRVRIEATPGAPGIRGEFPHIHPALIETFTCVSGSMTARVGRATQSVVPGQTVEVPPGAVHGFVNTGAAPLVVDSEILFPRGRHDPSMDLMDLAAIYTGLIRDGRVNPRTRQPSMLQMAVLLDAYRTAMTQPGRAGLLLKALAPIGRLRGYRTHFPEYTSPITD